MFKTLLRPLVLISLCCAQTPALAQTATAPAANGCNLEGYAQRRPGYAEGRPTQVSVGITIVDILNIDDADQLINIDLYVIMQWRDPKLAHLAGCRLPSQSIWSPDLELINSGKLESRFEPQVDVGEGGEIRFSGRFRGDLAAPHNMSQFPHDTRVIDLSLISLRNNRDELILEVNPTWSTRTQQFSVVNWEMGEVSAAATPEYFEQLEDTFSVYTLTMEAKRKPVYFFYKVALPLCMITVMSFAVFWIDPRQFAPQLGMAATSVLTLVAFQFSLSELLPKVGYLTRMDLLVLGTNVFVFSALIESVSIGYLVTHDRDELAIRIDTLCRWLFPIAYLGYLLFVFT